MLARPSTLTRVLVDNIYDSPRDFYGHWRNYCNDRAFQKLLSQSLTKVVQATTLYGLKSALGNAISDLGLRLINGSDEFAGLDMEVRLQAAIEVGRVSWPGEEPYWTSVEWARNLTRCMRDRENTYRTLLEKISRGEDVGVGCVDRVLLALLADLVRKRALLEEMYPEETCGSVDDCPSNYNR